MRVTDLVKIDKDYRNERKAITLGEAIQQRLQYHYKNSVKELRDVHVNRARSIAQELETWLSSPRLVRDEFISHTIYAGSAQGDSPRRCALLKAPVNDVLDWIFHGLRPPGPAQHDSLTQVVVEQMNLAGRQKRAAIHQQSLAYEIAYRTAHGWYLIFNTLTVAPGEYYKVFDKSSTSFQDYIRKADRLFAQASYGSVRNAKGQTYHTYFAVVEEGAQNGRLHIHVIHAFETLPVGTQDPNYSAARPTRRELNTLKALWPHGFSSPIIVRYSPDDAYGRKGFRWPEDANTQSPLLVGSPLKLASYMSKYITKSYTSNKRSKILWRVRKSQQLGRPLLQELLSTLTPQSLVAMATDPSLNLRLNNQKVPPELLRLESLRRYNQLSSKTTLPSLYILGKDILPLPSLLHSARGSTQSSQAHNRANFTHIMTRAGLSEAIFSRAERELKEAGDRINAKYFRNSTHAFGTTSTRDYVLPTGNAAAKAS